MIIEEVTIIAGGLGSRLGKLGEQIPKVLIPLKEGTLLDRHLKFIQIFSPQKISLILASKYKKHHSLLSKKYSSLNILWEEETKGISASFLEEILSSSKSKLILFGDVFHQNSFFFSNEIKEGITLGVAQHRLGNPQNECQVTFNEENEVIKIEDKAKTRFSEWCWNGMTLLYPLNSNQKKYIQLHGEKLSLLAPGNIFTKLQDLKVPVKISSQRGDYINLNTLEDLNLLTSR